MGRRRDVDDVHVRVVHEVPPVGVGGECRIEPALAGFDRVVKVVLVDVANRHEPALLVTGEMERGHADASDADDAPCKLVAGGHEPFVSAHGTENVPGKQGESGDAGACFLEE